MDNVLLVSELSCLMLSFSVQKTACISSPIKTKLLFQRDVTVCRAVHSVMVFQSPTLTLQTHSEDGTPFKKLNFIVEHPFRKPQP
jgi:hypothetical protein